MIVPLVQIRRPYTFTSPFGGEVFAALIVVVDPAITPEERRALSDQLVAQACRYAVCAGFDCSSWDDAIDMASVMAKIDGTPHFGLVMTTWHEDQTLEEVVEFFQFCVVIDDEQPRHRVAILVGDDEARRAELLQELEAQFGAEG